MQTSYGNNPEKTARPPQKIAGAWPGSSGANHSARALKNAPVVIASEAKQSHNHSITKDIAASLRSSK